MKLYHLCSGPLKVNTYFLVDETTNNAVVIDSSENYNLIKQTEEKYKFKITAVLLTHAHFDHSGNAKKLQDDGARIYIGVFDAPKLLNEDNLSSDFGRKFDYLTADVLLSDGEEFEINNIKFKCIWTPGHTDGSVTYLVDNMLFTGDTLFCESVGRTDFKSGSYSQIVESVKKLYALSGEYFVYPGHEKFTTLDHERKYNKFVEF